MNGSDRGPRSDGLRTVWLTLSSTRTTGILVMAMALAALVVAFVPQGREAVELAKSEHAERLRTLIAWGFTDLFSSKWFQILAVLFAANVTAASLRILMSSGGTGGVVKMPGRAPLSAEIEARAPERVVEVLRRVLRTALRSSPVAEGFDGRRVTLVFDAGRGARFAPILAHLGLVLLVMGGARAGTHEPGATIPFGRFEVKDVGSQKIGHFDMVANEPFQLFQSRAQYVLRNYVRDKDGLGPAVRIEKLAAEQGPVAFWVYLLAPNEPIVGVLGAFFDERHRGDVVAFRALEMGERPIPGHGFGATSAGVWMALGVGLLMVGALAGTRASGRLWVEADGERVRVLGAPRISNDASFAAGFERWTYALRLALAEDQ